MTLSSYPDGIQSTLGPESVLPLAAEAAGAGIGATIVDFLADLLGISSSDSDEKPASVPVGRGGNPVNVAPGTNSPAAVGDLNYSGHALDEMQGDGIMPSAVQNAVENVTPVVGKEPGTTAYIDTTNNITVIVDSNSGRVVTVSRGLINQ
jgi:filamentous hemagglutinin